MFVLSDWVLFGIIIFAGICISIFIGLENEGLKDGVISALICAFVTAAIMTAIGWYNTNTASGKRRVKDFHSEVNNGIKREIVITAENGREIFRYTGKIDVESNHDDNYIKFESEEGKRYIIYYGVQDTITIIEK